MSFNQQASPGMSFSWKFQGHKKVSPITRKFFKDFFLPHHPPLYHVSQRKPHSQIQVKGQGNIFLFSGRNCKVTMVEYRYGVGEEWGPFMQSNIVTLVRAKLSNSEHSHIARGWRVNGKKLKTSDIDDILHRTTDYQGYKETHGPFSKTSILRLNFFLQQPRKSKLHVTFSMCGLTRNLAPFLFTTLYI